MSDLISRSALKAAFEEDGHLSAYIEEYIDDAPAVDAVPVVHGQWVYGEDVDIQCSECGRDAMSDWMKYTQVYSPYCPWCGAKMDAKEGEQDEG